MPAIEDFIDDLSGRELLLRNKIIESGLGECRFFLAKQKNESHYSFYEGSLTGFEECRNLRKFSEFADRMGSLYREEIREVSKCPLNSEELKEKLQIYNKNEKTNFNEFFRLKGIRAQILFIHDRLILYRAKKEKSCKMNHEPPLFSR